MTIPCFWLEPTDRCRRYLRRFTHLDYAAGEKAIYPPDPCHNFHEAMVRIEDAPLVRDERGYIQSPASVCVRKASATELPDALRPYASDPHWPSVCECCGKPLADADNWQLFIEPIYICPDTGEETTLRDAPPGACWDAFWMAESYCGADGICLVVKTPGGDWMVDGQASNCTDKDDWKQPDHHYCWVRHGDPKRVPTDLHVDKQGRTCAAGAGSIGKPRWHGFLHRGQLVEA